MWNLLLMKPARCASQKFFPSAQGLVTGNRLAHLPGSGEPSDRSWTQTEIKCPDCDIVVQYYQCKNILTLNFIF